jgi:hypothetical protein
MTSSRRTAPANNTAKNGQCGIMPRDTRVRGRATLAHSTMNKLIPVFGVEKRK